MGSPFAAVVLRLVDERRDRYFDNAAGLIVIPALLSSVLSVLKLTPRLCASTRSSRNAVRCASRVLSRVFGMRLFSRALISAYAPPRSGKGVGLVVPTMLTWPHSAVVTDLKREIYELTAKWRGTEGGNRILRFEPASLEASVH